MPQNTRGRRWPLLKLITIVSVETRVKLMERTGGGEGSVEVEAATDGVYALVLSSASVHVACWSVGDRAAAHARL